jgi:hypothetical protein
MPENDLFGARPKLSVIQIKTAEGPGKHRGHGQNHVMLMWAAEG